MWMVFKAVIFYFLENIVLTNTITQMKEILVLYEEWRKNQQKKSDNKKIRLYRKKIWKNKYRYS